MTVLRVMFPVMCIVVGAIWGLTAAAMVVEAWFAAAFGLGVGLVTTALAVTMAVDLVDEPA